jgi:hypothetical protein
VTPLCLLRSLDTRSSAISAISATDIAGLGPCAQQMVGQPTTSMHSMTSKIIAAQPCGVRPPTVRPDGGYRATRCPVH